MPASPTGKRTHHGRELTAHAHSVQFYENDAFLAETVADFIAAGLLNGQRAIAIATPEHRRAIADSLHERGFDVERACTNGQIILLDADETLATFMVGAVPDAARFRAATDGLLGSHARFGSEEATRKPVLAFGEMVDRLRSRGNVEGALRLEELWNELAAVYSFSLLCAYRMQGFAQDSDDAPLRAVCDQHAHVVPTERYVRMEDDARAREIALLQQRALALESELERRQDLENELRDALRSARAASRSKREFLSLMSHELRTPLNAIGGHAQLLELGLHGPVNDAQREALARVQRSQRHLLTLINDLLNLARCDSGQLEYRIESVPVTQAVEEVVSLLAPLASANGLACVVRRHENDGPLSVNADPEKLDQILLNLLGNAIKFSPNGGLIIVEAERSVRDGRLVEIRVRDRGIGIPASKLDSIFEPFVQLGGSAVPLRDGVGLGLSISRSLARGMGGDLTAESELGVGTTISLTLPRA